MNEQERDGEEYLEDVEIVSWLQTKLSFVGEKKILQVMTQEGLWREFSFHNIH